jgi:hypothetical protein
MHFIFMLTNQDRTVRNCMEILDSIAGLGIRHIGFKDIGVGFDTMQAATRQIRAMGASAYMEVVSTTPERIRESMDAAVELGVDKVLGGSDIAYAERTLAPAGIGYYPFPGRPEGHPTRLGGTPAMIARDCATARRAGCPGVDLLAYRAVDADPVALVRAAREALVGGDLIVAGSIDSPHRIAAMAAAGADAFTIGTAVFEGRFAPGRNGTRAQCAAVLEACAA